MSTLNCEKENLLEQTVLVKRPLSNFEKGTLFFVHPLVIISSLMEDTPKRTAVIKAKFNKIVPKCSFPSGFCTIKTNFCVLNYFKVFLN